MAFEEELIILASATSTMDLRVQEMIVRLAREEPRIRNIEKGEVEFHFKDHVDMSVTDHTDRKIPHELRIRAK